MCSIMWQWLHLDYSLSNVDSTVEVVEYPQYLQGEGVVQAELYHCTYSIDEDDSKYCPLKQVVESDAVEGK